MDEKYMQVAIQLADGVKGQTTPNPPVGVVVVKKGAIIGIGAHMHYGKEHAEVIALDMAGEQASGATLYTTLEPCSHIGQTPPCVQLIITKQIKRVVVACVDKHEKVAGQGIAQLQAAGIHVEVGVLENKAAYLYEEFFYSIQTKLPYITVKAAMSLDGKIATHTGESKWITNEAARVDAHQYRHKHDAILVGIHTVLKDNPSLTTRLPEGRNPVRVILDTDLRTPVDAKIVTDGQAATWIFVGNQVTETKKALYSTFSNVTILSMQEKIVDLEKVLQGLTERHISTVLVEGGGIVNDSFLRGGFMNQLILYIAPIIIGGKRARSPFSGEGFASLQDAFAMNIEEVDMLQQQIKVVATRKDEVDVYRNR